MRRLIFGLSVLAACTPAPDIGVTDVRPLRDFEAPIASQVNVTAQQLEGDWHVVAAFSGAPGGPGLGQELRLSADADAALVLSFSAIGCSEVINLCESERFAQQLAPLGQGRWQAASSAGWLPSGPIWVLWLDADARTAVIGRPDGLAAWVMDRNSAGSRDRLTAGRDILDWFGYDLARLEEVAR